MADIDDKALTEQISNTPSPQGQEGDDDDAVEVGFRTWYDTDAPGRWFWYPFTGFYIVICGASFTSYVVADIGGATSITWLPNAYEVVVLALAAFMCSIGDVYGRRVLLLGGAVLTFIGCILIAVAQNINVVIVGSALTAGLFANQGNFYTIPAEVLPKRYRGVGATLGAAAGGLGAVAAYLAEGAFIRDYERVGWRYGFYVGAFFAALSGVMLHFFYRPIHKPTKTIAYVLAHDIDWVGTGLQLVFAVPFLIGLNWGGNAYPWSSVHVIATMSVGGASLIALIVHQVFFKKNGLFNHDLFECRNFTISALGLFIEGIIFLALLLFLPYMILTMYETRPFMQSLRILPLWIAFTIFAPLVGLYSRKTRDLKNPLIAGFALVLVAVIVLATSGVKSGNLVIGMLFVAGVGFSAPLALFNATAQLAVPKRLLGLATGQFIAARAFGSSVGAIIFIAILTAKSEVYLPAEISKAAVAEGLAETSLPALVGGILLQNATLLESTPGLNPEIMAAALEGLKEGYSMAFHYGWYAVIPFVAIAILMCIGLDSAAIKSQMNWVVDNPVEEIHHVDHNLDHHKGESETA
ncbi:hypothetical protein RQP46_003284 [Phenoliferia psychrophenolica]